MAKRGGMIVAAAAMAIVLANVDDDGSGLATGPAAGPATPALTSQFAASREAMLRGQVAAAWARLGLSPDPDRVQRRDTDCAAHSYGQVREYFRRVPCQWLDRLLFSVHDKGGNTIVVAVAWVRFATPAQAQELKRIDDTWGTGQIHPLPGSSLGLPDVRLSGQHYASRRAGPLTVIAEAEETTGELADSFLDELARVAVLLPHQ
jgi:hypothetical protein